MSFERENRVKKRIDSLKIIFWEQSKTTVLKITVQSSQGDVSMCVQAPYQGDLKPESTPPHTPLLSSLFTLLGLKPVLDTEPCLVPASLLLSPHFCYSFSLPFSHPLSSRLETVAANPPPHLFDLPLPWIFLLKGNNLSKGVFLRKLK